MLSEQDISWVNDCIRRLDEAPDAEARDAVWRAVIGDIQEAKVSRAARELLGSRLESQKHVALAEQRAALADLAQKREAFAEFAAFGFAAFGVRDRERAMTVRVLEKNDLKRTPSEVLRDIAARGARIAAECGGRAPERFADFKETPAGKRLLALDAQINEHRTLDEGEAFEDSWACVVIKNAHFAARWVESGLNQFRVESDLAAALVLTDAPKAEEPEMPFECFVIHLPPGAVPFFLPDDPDGPRQWANALWVHRHDGKVEVVTCRGQLAIGAVEGCFRSDLTQVPEDEVTVDAALRFVRNFLLWLEATGGTRARRPEQVPKKLAEKRKRGGETWPVEWIFGKEVKISRELRDAAAEIALGTSKRRAPDGWKVRARFVVRGHWRNQAVGEGRRGRVRKWIAPFWKGPAGAAAWAHLYTS